MKDTVFFKQAELLLRILPLIHKEEAFALKGGTAIIHKRFRSNLTPSCQLFASDHHYRSQADLFFESWQEIPGFKRHDFYRIVFSRITGLDQVVISMRYPNLHPPLLWRSVWVRNSPHRSLAVGREMQTNHYP
jgi:hypothetical protein